MHTLTKLERLSTIILNFF